MDNTRRSQAQKTTLGFGGMFTVCVLIQSGLKLLGSACHKHNMPTKSTKSVPYNGQMLKMSNYANEENYDLEVLTRTTILCKVICKSGLPWTPPRAPHTQTPVTSP